MDIRPSRIEADYKAALKEISVLMENEMIPIRPRKGTGWTFW